MLWDDFGQMAEWAGIIYDDENINVHAESLVDHYDAVVLARTWKIPLGGNLNDETRATLIDTISEEEINGFVVALDSIIEEQPLFNINHEILCIESLNNVPCTMLMFAIRYQSHRIVKLLLGEYGASANDRVFLSDEFLLFNDDVSNPLINSPLTMAIYGRNEEMIRYLIECVGVNVNDARLHDYNDIFHTILKENAYVGVPAPAFYLEPNVLEDNTWHLTITPYLLNQVGASTHQMSQYFGACKANLPVARSIAASSMILPTECKLCLLLLCYFFVDPYSLCDYQPLDRIINIPLLHYQYVFETLGMKDEIRSLPSSSLFPQHSNAIGITAKLFMQANAINFDIVKYLIETVGLDPNIGWSSENVSSSLPYNLKHACDMEYLIEKCGNQVTKELVLHYLSKKRYCKLSIDEFFQFMTLFANQPQIDLKALRFGNFQDTLLHKCMRWHPEIQLIKGFIDKFGLDPTIVNTRGQNALMCIETNKIGSVETFGQLLDFLVLELGLDINAKDNAGKTLAKILDFRIVDNPKKLRMMKAHLKRLNAKIDT